MNVPDTIIREARSWIGTPYRHQASMKGVGCDCLGLIRGVWRAIYGQEPETPPPYTPEWRETSGIEPLLEAALRHMTPVGQAWKGGDILLFRWRDHLPAKHCAIATGPDTMIHAHDGAAVTEVVIGPWWRRHCVGGFEMPQMSDNAGQAMYLDEV